MIELGMRNYIFFHIFLVTFRSLTGEVHCCCCRPFVLFTLKIAKNTNGVQYKELGPP